MPRAFTAAEREHITTALLAAAREALAAGAVRRLAIADLHRAAGISKGAFYLFFPSKEALVVAALKAVEAELRTQVMERLDGPDPLQGVLHALFRTAADHPLLGVLRDPEELAWLARSLPPGQLEAAREDDDRFFGEVLRGLIARGAARPDVDPTVFAGIPIAAMALAQQRNLVGADRLESLRDLLVEGLTLRLSPPESTPEMSSSIGFHANEA